MPTSKIRFRPGLVPTLATLLLLPVLVALGFWQLNRAKEQTQIQAELDARNRDNPVVLGAQVRTAEDLRYFRIVAKGYYDTRYQILLDNQVQDGNVGYDVITPLHLAGSDIRVLVNRGWIPIGVDRAHLPRVETPPGEQQITGIATIPSTHSFMLAHPGPVSGPWQTVWESMDMRRYRQSVPFPLEPAVVLLDPDSPAAGFVRHWKRPDTRVAMHQSYAFQWFALAAALVIIYIWVNIQRDGGGPREPDQETE